MKQMTAAELSAKTPEEIGDLLSKGLKIVEISEPLIKMLFNKISDLIGSLGANNPNSPKNVRIRLAALEAKDNLQKALNKTFEARLAALEPKP